MTDHHVHARRSLSSLLAQRCGLLGLQCECPFLAGNPPVEFAGYLPNFGGGKGILIDVVTDPDFRPGEAQKLAALKTGLPVSFVNPETFLSDAHEFILALRDWGFFGQSEDLSDTTRKLILPTRA